MSRRKMRRSRRRKCLVAMWGFFVITTATKEAYEGMNKPLTAEQEQVFRVVRNIVMMLLHDVVLVVLWRRDRKALRAA